MPRQRRGRRGLSGSGHGSNTTATAAASRSGDSRVTNTSQATQSTSGASRAQGSRDVSNEVHTPVVGRTRAQQQQQSPDTPTEPVADSHNNNSNNSNGTGRGRVTRRRAARVRYTARPSPTTSSSAHSSNSSSNHSSRSNSSNSSVASSPPSTQALTALPSAVAAGTIRLPRPVPPTRTTNERTALLVPPQISSTALATRFPTPPLQPLALQTAAHAEDMTTEKPAEATCCTNGIAACQAVRLQSFITLLLSCCFHCFHILLLLSLVFSGTAMRSLFFSPTSMSKTLLRQVQTPQSAAPLKIANSADISSKQDNNNGNKNTLPWVESVWSIHDARFFLVPGGRLVPVHIGDSFAARRGHRTNPSRQKTSISDGSGNVTHSFATTTTTTTTTATTNVMRATQEGSGTTPSCAAAQLGDGSMANITQLTNNNTNDGTLVQVMAAKADTQGKKVSPSSTHTTHSNAAPHKAKKIRLSALAAAWEASPLYSSPLALCVYYYLYLMGCLIMLYVLHTPQLTGHYALLRLVIALLEVLWYIQHGSHALLLYVWLLFLSHWPGRNAAQTSTASDTIKLERLFLRRGTPYAVIAPDGPAHIRWYYYDDVTSRTGTSKSGHSAGRTLHDESVDLTHYLYNHTTSLVRVTEVMTLCLLMLLVVCILRDGRRCAEALAGLRPLRQPEHCLVCPLCDEVMIIDEIASKRHTSTNSSVRRWWRWLWLHVRYVWPHRVATALHCRVKHRILAQPKDTADAMRSSRLVVVVKDAFYGAMRIPTALLPSAQTRKEEHQLVVQGTVLPLVRHAPGEDDEDVVVMEVQYDGDMNNALRHPSYGGYNSSTGQPTPHSTTLAAHNEPLNVTHAAAAALTPNSTPTSAALSVEDHRNDLARLTHRVHHRCPRLYLDQSAENTSEDDEDDDNNELEDSLATSSATPTRSSPSNLSHSSGTSLTSLQAASLSPQRVPRGRSFSPRRHIPTTDDVTSKTAQPAETNNDDTRSVLQRQVRTVPGASPGLPVRSAAMLTNASAAFMSFAYPANYGTINNHFSNNENEANNEEEGLVVAGHGTRRAAYEPLKDTEDEFRPGNAFFAYDTVTWLQKVTGSWLDACMQYTLLEPALFRHERFLPALPPSLASLETTLLSAWRLWVNRKVWYREARSAPSARLLPTKATLQRVAQDTYEENMVHVGSMEVANGEANRVAESDEEDDDDDDDEEEDIEHGGPMGRNGRNSFVSPTGPQGLSDARLRPQRPRRALREQIGLWLTQPVRAALSKLFYLVYIAHSQTIRHTYEHMLHGLTRQGHGVTDTQSDIHSNVSESERESVLPTHMYDYLTRSDVSLFRLFLEHRSGRGLSYRAGPYLLLRELLLIATVPVLAQLLNALVGLACVDLQHDYHDSTTHQTSDLCQGYAIASQDTTVTEQVLFSSALRWGAILTGLLIMATLAAQAYSNELCLATLEARNALSSLLLEKVMVLPLAQQQSFTADEVTRLVERDVGHVCAALHVLHRSWSYPLRLLFITGLLAYYLHWLPALLVLVCTACVVLPLGRVGAARIRQALRHNAVSERGHLGFLTRVLSHMREVKASALEPLCAELAQVSQNVRSDQEGSSHTRQSLWRAQVWLVLWTEGGLLLLSLLCFSVYYLMTAVSLPLVHIARTTNNTPSAAQSLLSSLWRLDRIVPCIAAIDLLLVPLTSFPSMCGCLVRGYLAMKRIEAYLRHTPDVFTGTWMDVTQLTSGTTSNTETIKQPSLGKSGSGGATVSVSSLLAERHGRPERGTVRCIAGCFTWQSDPIDENNTTTSVNTYHNVDAVTLREVNMTVLPGELAVVQGSVGSGKTTLLLAMLGEVNRCVTTAPPVLLQGELNDTQASTNDAEVPASHSITVAGRPIAPLTHSMCALMHLTSPTTTSGQNNTQHTSSSGFEVYGSCAYCAQQPWLQANTIRANILAGGSAAETRWYKQVLQACALNEDLAALPLGEHSVVGEGGLRVSQSLRVRIALARAVFARADIYILDGILTPLSDTLRRHIVKDVIHGLLRHRTVILASNVGLSELQPHRIFTITEQGAVREDTHLYPAIQSTRKSRDNVTGTANLVQQTGEAKHTEVKNSANAAVDETAPLPTLFAEEYVESVVAVDEIFSAASSTSSGDADEGEVNEGATLGNTQGAVEAEVCLGTAGNEVALELTEHSVGGGSLLAQERNVRHVDLVQRTRFTSAERSPNTPPLPLRSSSSTTATTLQRTASAGNNDNNDDDVGYNLALLARHSSSESSSHDDDDYSSSSSSSFSALDTRDAERKRAQAKGAVGAKRGVASMLISVPAPANATNNSEKAQADTQGTSNTGVVHELRPHTHSHVRVTNDWRSLTMFYRRYLHGHIDTWATLLTAMLYGICVLLVWLHLAGWLTWQSARHIKSTTDNSGTSSVVPSLYVLLVFVALGELCLVLQTYFFHATMTRAMHEAEQEAWTHVLRAPLSLFDSPHPQLLLGIFNEDIRRAHATLPATFAVLLSSVLQLCFTVGVVSVVHPSFLLLLPFAVLMSGRVTRRVMCLTRQLHRLQRRAQRDTVSVLRETVRGAATVRCLSLQDRTRESYAQSLHTSTAAAFTSTMALGWAHVRLCLLATVLVFAFIVMWAWSRHTSPSLEVIALLLTLRLLVSLPLLCETLSQLHHLWAPQRRVLELLSLPAEPMYGTERHLKEAEDSTTTHREVNKEFNEDDDGHLVLQLEQVSAQHRLAPQYGLRHFSLKVYDGGVRLGLVGRPGSGRSMLPEVLLRLAMVTHESGTVWLYGYNSESNVRRVAAHAVPYPVLRRMFHYVSMDPQLRLMRWRDHLHIESLLLEMNAPTESNTTSTTNKGMQPFMAAWQALHTVGLDGMAQADGGLDAPIRPSLNVVQRQLLCLARAFLYQPRFILYEEAEEVSAETSTLHDALRTASTSWACTVILLPRRRTTVATLCTRVVLVENGTAAAIPIEGDTASQVTPPPLNGYEVNEAVLAALEPYMNNAAS